MSTLSSLKIVVTGTRGIPNIMGGVETHCEELFPRIAAKGFDVTVVRRTAYVESEERREERGEWKGVKLVDIGAPKRKALEAVIHTFRAVTCAKRMGADIVHIHAIGPALLTPYAKLLGMKVVFTHHGADYERQKWGKVAKFALRLGERLACKWADEVIVISEVIRQSIARKYGRTEHVHLIYNGVPAPQRCDYDDYFHELGIGKDKYILAACRFVPEKRLEDIVLACQGMDMKGCKLVLAGDADFESDYSRSLKAQARQAGVVLTGFVKDRKLHALMTHCRAFVLSSSHEGLPIALLEAMSYSLRVVVSDIPANLEVGLTPDVYYPTGHIPSLRSCLQKVVDEPLSHPAYDLSKYDWDTIAEQVERVYLGVEEREERREENLA